MAASTGGSGEDGAPAARPRPCWVPGSDRGSPAPVPPARRTLRPPRGALALSAPWGPPQMPVGLVAFPAPGTHSPLLALQLQLPNLDVRRMRPRRHRPHCAGLGLLGSRAPGGSGSIAEIRGGELTWGHPQVGKRCASLPESLHNAPPNRRVRSRQGHPRVRGARAERESLGEQLRRSQGKGRGGEPGGTETPEPAPAAADAAGTGARRDAQRSGRSCGYPAGAAPCCSAPSCGLRGHVGMQEGNI